jgi:hypothetical protein
VTIVSFVFEKLTYIPRCANRFAEIQSSTCRSKLEKEFKMSDVPVTLVLPSGGTRNAEVPDDVPVKDLIPELTTSLELPVTGPDGRAMSYRIDSKALGRELKEEETLQQAGIPQNDRLMMTADVTAG